MCLNLLFYVLFLVGFISAAYFYLESHKASLRAFLFIWSSYAILSILVAINLARDLFDGMSLLSVGLFVGAVVLFFLSGKISWHKHKAVSATFVGFGIALGGIGLDAF
ncbi:MAG: hypothetical protein K2Z81_14540, partial [Cyanobacteria bacterium]|nr:hypothetical protein [Cyanobacteriota bacterium]